MCEEPLPGENGQRATVQPVKRNPTAVDLQASPEEHRAKQTTTSARKQNGSPFEVVVGQVYDGPLDLLLDLIRKQDIDIYDIPIARITAQFLSYVERREMDIDAAGEFVYVASLLIQIKSRMLLPLSQVGEAEENEDPRRELVDRLLEHERFQRAAQMLFEMQQVESATWSNPAAHEFRDNSAADPEIVGDTIDLARVFREIASRMRDRPVLNIDDEPTTVANMLDFVRRRLIMEDRPVSLRSLLQHAHSPRVLVAMFLALLEMVRLQAILLRQNRNFADIYIKKHPSFESVMQESASKYLDDWK